MSKKYWLYFTTIVHLFVYGRLYDWFSSNINRFTMSYVYNSEFALSIVVIPFTTSLLFFKFASHKKIDKNYKIVRIIEKIIILYNIFCFVYFIFDRKMQLINKWLVIFSKLMLDKELNGMLSFGMIIIALVIFALYERLNNKIS